MSVDAGRPVRVERVTAYALLGLLVLVLVVHAAPAMTRPFGPAHDGVNGAVWGANSRALRTEGIEWSRMGTRGFGWSGVRSYAHHPPLLVLEAAAAEEIFGEHPWSTRLPALVSTIVAIIAAAALLRVLGVSWPAAVAGVALGFGVPMVGVYGSMLDTPIVGLAPAVVLLLLDARRRRGLRSPAAAVGIVAAVCVLSSWESLALAALLAVASAVRLARKRPLAHDWAMLVGVVAGTAAFAGWMYWAYGSWTPVAHQLGVRSGLGLRPRSLGDVIHALRDDAGGLFPVWVAALGLVAFAAGLRDCRTRMAMGVSLGVVVVWVFGLRDGAVIHDYWPYWAVLPLALGFGAAADWLVSRDIRWSRAIRTVVVVAATVLGAIGLTTSVVAGQVQAFSSGAGRLIRTARWSPTQNTVWVIDPGKASLEWASYDSHRRADYVNTAAALRSLGTDRPTDLVLFLTGRTAAQGQPCSRRIHRAGSFALLPAGEAVMGFDGQVIRPC